MRRLARSLQTCDKTALKPVEELSGLLTFASPAVQLGWVFCREIWWFAASFSSHTDGVRLPVPAAVRLDLQWWEDSLSVNNGVAYFDFHTCKMFHLFTDASGKAMGGFFYESRSSDWKAEVLRIRHYYSERFTQLNQLDINPWEVRAILRAFERWAAPFWTKHRVIIHTDSATAQAGICKGTLNSAAANTDLRSLLCLASQLDIAVQAVHIAGVENELADALSRLCREDIANWCPQWETAMDTPLQL